MQSSPARREQIVSPLNVVLIAALFVVAFILLMPERATYTIGDSVVSSTFDPQHKSDRVSEGSVDDLEAAYLKAQQAAGQLSREDAAAAIMPLLRSRRPAMVRSLLAAFPDIHLTAHEQFRLALETAAANVKITSAVSTDNTGYRALMAQLDHLLQDASLQDLETLTRAVDLSLLLDDETRKASLTRLLVETLNRMSALDTHPPARLEELSRVLLAVQRPDVAHVVFASLADRDLKHRVHWLNEAARWAEASNAYTAAIGYLDALIENVSVAEARAIIRKQAGLLVASGNSEAARDRLSEHLSKFPDDRPERRLLAHILEWTGNPTAAAEQWQWLAIRIPDTDNLAQWARLAEINLEPAVAARALQELSLLQEPSQETVDQLVAMYERNGQPQNAVSALSDIVQRYGARTDVLRTLAALHQRHFQYRAALQVWERIGTEEGISVEEIISRMELHWRLNEPGKAAALADLLEGATLDASVSEFDVRLLSEIAWRYHKPWLQRLIEPVLASIEDVDYRVQIGHRIVNVLREACASDSALTLARQLWRDTEDVDFAIAAMQLAIVQRDNTTLDAFMKPDQQSPALIAVPQYWTTLAAAREMRGESTLNQQAYHEALRLDPTDENAMAGLLWYTMDTGDQTELRQRLESLSAGAELVPALWPVFAGAWLRLRDPVSGMPWINRLIDIDEADEELLANYSVALEAIGQAEAATRLQLVLDELMDRQSAAEGIELAVNPEASLLHSAQPRMSCLE